MSRWMLVAMSGALLMGAAGVAHAAYSEAEREYEVPAILPQGLVRPGTVSQGYSQATTAQRSRPISTAAAFQAMRAFQPGSGGGGAAAAAALSPRPSPSPAGSSFAGSSAVAAFRGGRSARARPAPRPAPTVVASAGNAAASVINRGGSGRSGGERVSEKVFGGNSFSGRGKGKGKKRGGDDGDDDDD